MSRVPWHQFQDRQPQAHLVAAVVRANEADALDLQEVQRVLQRLVKKQKPAGEYATTIVRDTGSPELHLAFEHEEDARKLAVAVRAKANGSYPGWASQRAFKLDGAKVTTLAASLAAPKTLPSQPLPEERSMPRRSRRWFLPQRPSSRRD